MVVLWRGGSLGVGLERLGQVSQNLAQLLLGCDGLAWLPWEALHGATHQPPPPLFLDMLFQILRSSEAGSWCGGRGRPCPGWLAGPGSGP